MSFLSKKPPFSKTSRPLLTGILAFGFLFLSSHLVSADTNWVNPTGYVDGDWTNEQNARDDVMWTEAGITVPDGQINSSWLELFLDSPITSDRVRFYTLIPDGPGCGDVFDGPFTVIEFRIHKNGAWESASYYVPCWNESDWTELTFAQGSVDRLRLRFNKQGSQGSQPAAISEVDFGEYVCGNIAPGVTTLSSPSNGATGQPTSPTVSWNTVSSWGVNCAGNTNTYTVYLDTSSNPATNRGSVPAGTASLAISGLSNNTLYYWKVRASNGALSTDSSVWSFTTLSLPYLNVSPTTLTFSATQGGSNPSNQGSTVWNTGGGTLSWTASDNQTWLSISPTSYTGNSTTLWAVVDITSLAAGSYSGTITITGAAGTQNSPQTVTVNLTICANTAPSVTTLSSPSSGATGQPTSLTLDWNDVASWGVNCAGNTNTYRVLLDTSSNPATNRGTVPEGTTSLAISGLSNGTTYYWKVRARNGALTSDSAVWSFTTVALPYLNVSPTTVNLSATQGTGTITCGGSGQGSCPSVWNSGGGTLSWTTSPSSPDGWLSWTPASDGNGPTTLWVSATINGLAAGSYSKTIIVTGAAGTQNSPQTVTVNLTICANTAPSVTTLSSPANGATGQSTSPTVSWNTVSSWGVNCAGNTNTYTVYLDTSSNPATNRGSVPAGTTSLAISGLSNNTLYYWKVRASNGALSTDSSVWSFTTLSLPYLNVSPTIVNLSATQGTGTITCGGSGQDPCPSVWNTGGGTLSWTTSPSSPDGWLSWTPASDGNGPTTLWVSATIDGLVAGSYSKTIIVTGAAGTQNSPQTVTINLTICGNTAPSVPTLSSPSNGATGQSTSPTVSWNAVSSWGVNCAGNTNTYRVFLDTNLNPTTIRGTVADGTTSLAISGLSNNTTYYWKVRARNGALSTDSAIWSFTTAALPYLNVSPLTITFTSITQGTSSTESKSTFVYNSGGGTLNWSASESSSWFWISPLSGSSTGFADGDTIWVTLENTSGLSVGPHSADITVSGQAGTQNSPQTVTVNLTVNQATGTISGYVWQDTDSTCPVPSPPQTALAGLTVSISPPAVPSVTTNPDGSYTLSSVPYDAGGTAYTMSVNKPSPADEWSYACACTPTPPDDYCSSSGGSPSQGFKTVTLSTSTSAWTVNFSIVNISPGWFQVIDGDIHAEQNINDPIPAP